MDLEVHNYVHILYKIFEISQIYFKEILSPTPNFRKWVRKRVAS